MNYEQKSILKILKDLSLALLSNSVLQQIVYLIFPFVISCVLKNADGQTGLSPATFYSYPQVLYFSVYIALLIGFSFAKRRSLKQEEYSELNRAVVDELQNNISSLTQYLVNLENDENEEIFASLSQFVCHSLYTIFSKRYNDRSFRISVIKQFLYSNDLVYTKTGFKSSDLSTGDNRPRLVADCKKYYRTILQSSNERHCIFDEMDIEDKFVFSNPNHEKLEEYIAIPHKGDFNNICFILQIDCTKKGSFGKNKAEIECFINKYLRPFEILLENAYVQERMNTFYRGADQIETKTTYFD